MAHTYLNRPSIRLFVFKLLESPLAQTQVHALHKTRQQSLGQVREKPQLDLMGPIRRADRRPTNLSHGGLDISLGIGGSQGRLPDLG